MIIVDALIIHPNAWGPFRSGSCHMTSTISEDELHAFARELGLKRSWFQLHRRYPHYDLTPRRRRAAITLGAREVTSREFIRLCYAWRPPPWKEEHE